jgi:hypothetical protein
MMIQTWTETCSTCENKTIVSTGILDWFCMNNLLCWWPNNHIITQQNADSKDKERRPIKVAGIFAVFLYISWCTTQPAQFPVCCHYVWMRRRPHNEASQSPVTEVRVIRMSPHRIGNRNGKAGFREARPWLLESSVLKTHAWSGR